MGKILRFLKTYNLFSLYSRYDSRLRKGVVFGRPWTPLKFSARFFPFWFGKYNYNNILLHAKGILANEEITISNKGTFNFTRYLEKKLLQKIVQLLRLSFSSFSGYITSGATEANIYAMWVAREWAKSKNASKIYWIMPNNVHYSIAKALNLLDITQEIIGIETDPLSEANCEKIIDNIKKIRSEGNDPIILPLTVMTTECGAIDPVIEIDKFITDSNIDNIFFHVDAAFSGLLLPFLDEYKNIFSLQSLTSISIDFSKTIGGPAASGAVIFRTGLEQYVITPALYLSEGIDQTLSGSRKGSDIIAMYSILSVNNPSDIKKDILEAVGKAKFLAGKLSKIEFIKLFYEPTLNYVVFSLVVSEKSKEEKIRKILKSYAVNSSIVKIGNEQKELFKIITRKDHKYKNIEKFIKDLKSI